MSARVGIRETPPFNAAPAALIEEPLAIDASWAGAFQIGAFQPYAFQMSPVDPGTTGQLSASVTIIEVMP